MNVFIARPKDTLVPLGILVIHESTNAPLMKATTPLSEHLLTIYSKGIRFAAPSTFSSKRDELICKPKDPHSFSDVGAKYYALAKIEISRIIDCPIDLKKKIIIVDGKSYSLTDL